MNESDVKNLMEHVEAVAQMLEKVVKDAGGEDKMSSTDTLLFILASQQMVIQGILARLALYVE